MGSNSFSSRLDRRTGSSSVHSLVIAAVVAVFLLCGTRAFGDGELIRGRLREATKLEEALYPPVVSLLRWPAGDASPAEQPDLDPIRLKIAERMSREWISRVFATHWHPALGYQFRFTAAEFDGRDTVRTQWIHEGWKVQVSQTASIMTILLTPVEAKRGTGRSGPEKFESARELCLDLFAGTARLRNANRRGEVDERNLDELETKIAGFSFDRRKLVELSGDKALVGRALTQEDEKIPVGPLAGAGLEGVDIERSAIGFTFWFRHIDWWNDGQSIGFHILKINGPGQWVPSYGGDIDRNWLRAKQSPIFVERVRNLVDSP